MLIWFVDKIFNLYGQGIFLYTSFQIRQDTKWVRTNIDFGITYLKEESV